MGRRLLIIPIILATSTHFFAELSTAADITMLEVAGAGGNATVALGDWGWQMQESLEVFAEEDWMTPGQFDISVDMVAEDPGRGGLLTVPTNFQKSVSNQTNFAWTGFTTTIIPAPGASISSVVASPNINFGNVAVIDNGNGSYSIDWDNLGNNGLGVEINDMATLSFSFDVTGPSSELVNYKIRQIPTPEPASILCVLIGIIVAGRPLRRQS